MPSDAPEREDQFDLPGVLAKPGGDLRGSVALVGEFEDRLFARVAWVWSGGVMACWVTVCVRGRRDGRGRGKLSDAVVGLLNEDVERFDPGIENGGELTDLIGGVCGSGFDAGVVFGSVPEFGEPLLGRREHLVGLRDRGASRLAQHDDDEEHDGCGEQDVGEPRFAAWKRGVFERLRLDLGRPGHGTGYHDRGAPATSIGVGVSGSSSEAASWIRGVRAAWRELSGGSGIADALRPTLVAVSGGAASAAVAIALGSIAEARIVLGHIVHDQRPAELVHDDRLAVSELGARLGVRVVVDHVRSGEGSVEHAARRARYAALDAIAGDHGCPFVVTGHHSRDQAETVLLAMLRGGSPDALLGIRRSRLLDDGSDRRVLRPALELHPGGAARVCSEFGYAPRVDATNRDPARARAELRRDVIPSLERVRDDLGPVLARTLSRLEARLGSSAVEECSDVGLEGFDA